MNFCGFFQGKMTNWKLQNEWLFSLVHSFFASRIKQKLRLKSAAKSLKSLRQNIDWKRSQHFSWHCAVFSYSPLPTKSTMWIFNQKIENERKENRNEISNKNGNRRNGCSQLTISSISSRAKKKASNKIKLSAVQP